MKRCLTIAVMVLFCLFSGRAQVTPQNRYDFNFIKSSHPWLTSSNAAGLVRMPVDRVAIAQAGFEKNNGEFRAHHQSDDSFNAGALTESFSRLGQNVFVYGKLSYDYFKGKNMGGSVMSDPFHSPFNIVAMADSTAGVKTLETYNLTGGVAYRFNRTISVGGKIDYIGGNYSKARDPRHVNMIMDMEVTAGLSFNIADVVVIGANYIFRRNLESFYFQIYGTTDKVYYYLVDYGGFFGQREVFGERGYSTKSSIMPLLTTYHGGALQLEIGPESPVKLFNEFSFKAFDGYYGKKSTSTIMYSAHEGFQAGYKSCLSFGNDHTQHMVNLNADYTQLYNHENVYQEKTVEGVREIIYFGSNEVLERHLIEGNMEYVANIGIKDHRPTLTIKASADAMARFQTSSLYPFNRKQNIFSIDGVLSAAYNIFLKKGIVGVRLCGGYGTGLGEAFRDGLYTQISNPRPPRTMNDAMCKEFEFLTANRINGGAGFRYSHFFKKNITGYIDLDYRLINAFGVSHLTGATHHRISATVGISF
ncbi:MAG: hypothetical protein GX993_06895 [Bacteroidales bacterium]|nr:hypothetical protein [Bacteroidales bacterium]